MKAKAEDDQVDGVRTLLPLPSVSVNETMLHALANRVNDETGDIDKALSNEPSRAVRAMLVATRCSLLIMVGFCATLTLLYLLLTSFTHAMQNETVAAIATLLTAQVTAGPSEEVTVGQLQPTT